MSTETHANIAALRHLKSKVFVRIDRTGRDGTVKPKLTRHGNRDAVHVRIRDRFERIELGINASS